MNAPIQHNPNSVLLALTLGLRDHLDGASADQALQLWKQEFANQDNTATALSRWCKDISARFNLRDQEAALYLKVFNALHGPTTPASGAPLEAGVHSSAKLLMAFCTALEAHAEREADGARQSSKLRQAWTAQAKVLAAGPQKAAVAWWSGHANQLAGNWGLQS
jgi:hypothetical protein